METKDLKQKLFVGLPLRTSNEKAEREMPLHLQRFWQEGISKKIPHKSGNETVILYTDYEGDHTKPYTYLVGSFVTSFENLPSVVVSKVIPAGTYAHFHVEGPFPQSLQKAWMDVWQMPLKRAYKADLEIYPENFDPMTSPALDLYIGL